MGHSTRNMENNDAEGDVNCREWTQEVSEKENVKECSKHRSFDILVKNVVGFCPFLTSLSEATLKSLRLTTLSEEYFKHLSVYFLIGVLAFTVMKINKGKKQAEQEKIKNLQLH